jgi:hypothetical protein
MKGDGNSFPLNGWKRRATADYRWTLAGGDTLDPDKSSA